MNNMNDVPAMGSGYGNNGFGMNNMSSAFGMNNMNDVPAMDSGYGNNGFGMNSGNGSMGNAFGMVRHY